MSLQEATNNNFEAKPNDEANSSPNPDDLEYFSSVVDQTILLTQMQEQRTSSSFRKKINPELNSLVKSCLEDSRSIIVKFQNEKIAMSSDEIYAANKYIQLLKPFVDLLNSSDFHSDVNQFLADPKWASIKLLNTQWEELDVASFLEKCKDVSSPSEEKISNTIVDHIKKINSIIYNLSNDKTPTKKMMEEITKMLMAVKTLTSLLLQVNTHDLCKASSAIKPSATSSQDQLSEKKIKN